MRLAFFTPLPPVRSGISVYAADLLPELARRAEVAAIVDQPEWEPGHGYRIVPFRDYRRDDYDAVIYELGNNPYHETIYREALRNPGVVDFHDVVLHHLIVEMTLARGLADEYIEIMRENHGAAGEAWARGRAAGFHDEIGNFLFPCVRSVAERATQVIVHNEYAAAVIRRSGVTTPVSVLDMPFPPPLATVREEGEGTTIGMFGFVTDSKRPAVVFEAFSIARRDNPALRLLVVGEPAPNLDLSKLARRFDVPDEAWQATGYVAEDAFDRYLSKVDRVVNLRYPTAGETSGALLRIFHAGKPVAVSDYGQFAEFPDDSVTKIPLGAGEIEALVEFMKGDPGNSAAAQRRWLYAHCDPGNAADRYVEIAGRARSEGDTGASAALGPIPLFPKLRLSRAERRRDLIELSLRNESADTLISASYGSPGYRLIVKVFDGHEEVSEEWLTLGVDLHPEQSVTVSVDAAPRGSSVRLFHALQGIPQLEPEAFASFEVDV
jgi:glycosyltransferase involved in cell wall biosynthesis